MLLAAVTLGEDQRGLLKPRQLALNGATTHTGELD